MFLEIIFFKMDPQALETVVEGFKAGGIILGASTACLTAMLGVGVGTMKYRDRKQMVDMLMPAYKNGHLTQKPNVFNIYKMTNPETAHLYYTKSVSK